MSDDLIGNAIETLIEGFIGGIFVAIGIKHDIPVDQEGITLFAAEKILESSKEIAPNVDYSTPELILFFAGIGIFLLTILAVLKSISRMDDWRLGAVLYTFGLIFGIGLIY